METIVEKWVLELEEGLVVVTSRELHTIVVST
jgi:hypothetical protein